MKFFSHISQMMHLIIFLIATSICYGHECIFYERMNKLQPAIITIKDGELHTVYKIKKIPYPKASSIVVYRQNMNEPTRQYRMQINLLKKPADDWFPIVQIKYDILTRATSVTITKNAGSLNFEHGDRETIISWSKQIAQALNVPIDKIDYILD